MHFFYKPDNEIKNHQHKNKKDKQQGEKKRVTHVKATINPSRHNDENILVLSGTLWV